MTRTRCKGLPANSLQEIEYRHLKGLGPCGQRRRKVRQTPDKLLNNAITSTILTGGWACPRRRCKGRLNPDKLLIM
jgi:hypothetical protein